jgi:hypothetical protein
MLKKSKTSYYNHFKDNSQVYPRLDVQVCNVNGHFNKERLLIELGENRYMTKENAIKFFKWVIEELESIPDS